MKKAHSAVEFVKQMTEGDEEFQQMVEAETINLRVAQLVYDARMAAGLTQKQLAEMIGTRQSAIARLEDADYEGHSLSMLRRVAAALGCRIKLDFEAIHSSRAS
jgi:ribosome-binding protein aMBF1 (putative translation factor)